MSLNANKNVRNCLNKNIYTPGGLNWKDMGGVFYELYFA